MPSKPPQIWLKEVILYKRQALRCQVIQRPLRRSTTSTRSPSAGQGREVQSECSRAGGTTDLAPLALAPTLTVPLPTCLHEDTGWHREKEDPSLLTSTQITQGSCLLKSRF